MAGMAATVGLPALLRNEVKRLVAPRIRKLLAIYIDHKPLPANDAAELKIAPEQSRDRLSCEPISRGRPFGIGPVVRTVGRRLAQHAIARPARRQRALRKCP